MHQRRLYAHRGASAERPENTMVAFARAVEIGVDALECDVHLTRDGHLIIAHDDTGQRMAAVRAPWSEMDLVEAQRLDVGWGFLAPDGTRPFAGKGICVPRFAELVEAFPNVRINVDIKKDHRAIDAMLALCAAKHADGRVTIASFKTSIAVAVRRAGWSGESALSQYEVASLAALPAVAWRALPFTGTAAQIPVAQGPLRFDRQAFIAKCHALGLRVDFWTVDDRDEAARLLALGADGIMTNDPAALRPVFT
ncbi:MAG TPA: glycerophosphodiester phosphodiesterase family protein [Kofleriaceae bacterium]